MPPNWPGKLSWTKRMLGPRRSCVAARNIEKRPRRSEPTPMASATRDDEARARRARAGPGRRAAASAASMRRPARPSRRRQRGRGSVGAGWTRRRGSSLLEEPLGSRCSGGAAAVCRRGSGAVAPSAVRAIGGQRELEAGLQRRVECRRRSRSAGADAALFEIGRGRSARSVAIGGLRGGSRPRRVARAVAAVERPAADAVGTDHVERAGEARRDRDRALRRADGWADIGPVSGRLVSDLVGGDR